MYHVWVLIYGRNRIGNKLVEQLQQELQRGEMRFGFGIKPDGCTDPPNGLFGQHLVAGVHNVTFSETPGTHVLVFGCQASTTELSAIRAGGLTLAVSTGVIEIEMCISDTRPNVELPSPDMKGSPVLTFECLLSPGADGTPTIQPLQTHGSTAGSAD